jgi:PAS domain S-box-containing protein
MAEDDELTLRLEELFSTIPYVDPGGVDDGRTDVSGEPCGGAVLLQPAFQAVASENLFAYLFQATFENMPVGMSLVDLQGRLRRVNQAFCRMVGRTQEELEGASFQSLAHPEDLALGIKAMRELHLGRTNTARIEMRWLGEDGRVTWVDLSFGLVQEAAGKPAFFTLAALDVSKQHETARLWESRLQGLSCLSDITHQIDQRPEPEQFFEWIAKRVPAALQEPDLCSVAVEYQGRAYGTVEAMINPAHVTFDLIVNGALAGWLYLAYLDERRIANAERVLVTAIVSLVNSYLETVRQQKQLEKLDELLTAMGIAKPQETGVSTGEPPAASGGEAGSSFDRKVFIQNKPAGEKLGETLRRLLHPRRSTK